jgi:hypothetical protein
MRHDTTPLEVRQPVQRVLIRAVLLCAALSCMVLLLSALLPVPLRAQCTEAEKGSVTLFLFDMTSPDLPQDKLHRFLDILTFKLNTGIRDDLKSRGLLGRSPFAVRWCSGSTVTAPDDAIERGRRLGSAGVMWGVLDGGSGRLKSALKLTSLTGQPITGLSNVIYGQNQSELVNESYLAFAAYLLGKQHMKEGNNALARRALLYARDRKGLPDALEADLKKSLTTLEQGNPASALKPVGRGAK